VATSRTVVINTDTINFDTILKLRLVVARFGEQDVLHWWNTKGVLGVHGKTVYKLGFPRTAPFAQARVVFAVASARSMELWNPPGCATLWRLPPEVEDAFEDHWQTWTDDTDGWRPFFDALARIRGGDLLDTLRALEIIDAATEAAARDLRRSAEGKAVLLPGTPTVDDGTLALLGAGFFRGERGAPAIPYARLGDGA
jgi:hypothetical protein